MTDSASWLVGGFDDRQAGTVGTFRLASSGQVWATEFQQHWTLSSNDALKGKWIAGCWYQNTARTEVATGRRFADNYGLYVAGEQVLTQEKVTSDEGLAVFGQFGWAPADRNDLEFYFGAGLVYHGLIPGRDSDSIGLGLATARYGGDLIANAGRTHETSVELFYIAKVAPWAHLHPDIQYIANPSGNGRDAIAVGLRYWINF